MNRAIFFLVLATILILFDLYAYAGLKVAIAGLSLSVQRIIKVAFWLLTAITLVSFLLFEPMSQDPKLRVVLSMLMTVGVANIIGKLFFVIFLFIDDITRLVRWISAKFSSQDASTDGENTISRSKFLSIAGASAALVPLAAMSWGVISGAHDYSVKRRKLILKNLPKAFEGFTILQISDIHSGSFWSRKAVERGIDLINEQKADAVFFTGDIVNNKSEELEDWVDVFGRIEAPNGIFSVLGNHDYGDYVPWPSDDAKRANLDRLKELQKNMGWDLLLDQHRFIERDGASLAVIGIENWGAKGRFPKYGNLAKALKGAESAPVKLLLSHDPSHWRAQVIPEFPEIDVMFSGHTHGMQFGIEVGETKWSPVKYFYPEWADLYKEGNQQLYVNRGFGYIGYPGRLGITPEITVFTLASA